MDKKAHEQSNIIGPIENKFKEMVVPNLPPCITTYNLTMVSLVWSSLIVYAGHRSKDNIKWIYLIMLCVFAHLITDLLDGAVGRYRNTGAIKWGYFMDHSMDVILLSAVFFALLLRSPKQGHYIFLIYFLILLLMISSFLALDENGHDISMCTPYFCFGPTDGLIVLEVFLFYVIKVKGNVKDELYKIIISLFALVNVVNTYKKQAKLHKEDMILKSKSENKINNSPGVIGK